jgi:hypothetical protein
VGETLEHPVAALQSTWCALHRYDHEPMAGDTRVAKRTSAFMGPRRFSARRGRICSSPWVRRIRALRRKERT